jgi:transcriptional regulator with XRE-family HTH domain
VEERNFLHILGERLMRERARLGLTQAELAELTGIARRTQINYESGQRAPDAVYLDTVDKRGIDALFVVTGRRQSETLGALHAAEPRASYTLTGLPPANVHAAATAVFLHMEKRTVTLTAERAADAVIALAEMSKTPDEVARNAAHVLKLMS